MMLVPRGFFAVDVPPSRATKAFVAGLACAARFRCVTHGGWLFDCWFTALVTTIAIDAADGKPLSGAWS